MANRPKGCDMTAPLNKKKSVKFDTVLANEAIEWVINVVENMPHIDIHALREKEVTNEKDLQMRLKNGIILCHLVNVIKPGSVKKIHTGNTAFKQMENIGKFLAACESLGCERADLFKIGDLFEANNIPQVVNGIFALGRKASSVLSLPLLVRKEATKYKRRFSAEQLRAGERVIELQVGSNKRFSLTGKKIGKFRAIVYRSPWCCQEKNIRLSATLLVSKDYKTELFLSRDDY